MRKKRMFLTNADAISYLLKSINHQNYSLTGSMVNIENSVFIAVLMDNGQWVQISLPETRESYYQYDETENYTHDLSPREQLLNIAGIELIFFQHTDYSWVEGQSYRQFDYRTAGIIEPQYIDNFLELLK